MVIPCTSEEQARRYIEQMTTMVCGELRRIQEQIMAASTRLTRIDAALESFDIEKLRELGAVAECDVDRFEAAVLYLGMKGEQKGNG